MTAATAVVGSVALWGTVIEHTRGYRVEFAYPDRIRLVCAGCLYLFRGAAVPDRVVPLEDGRFAPVCAEHQGVVDAAGAPFDVEPLQQELLATYAVPLLRGEAYSADGT